MALRGKVDTILRPTSQYKFIDPGQSYSLNESRSHIIKENKYICVREHKSFIGPLMFDKYILHDYKNRTDILTSYNKIFYARQIGMYRIGDKLVKVTVKRGKKPVIVKYRIPHGYTHHTYYNDTIFYWNGKNYKAYHTITKRTIKFKAKGPLIHLYLSMDVGPYGVRSIYCALTGKKIVGFSRGLYSVGIDEYDNNLMYFGRNGETGRGFRLTRGIKNTHKKIGYLEILDESGEIYDMPHYRYINYDYEYNIDEFGDIGKFDKFNEFSSFNGGFELLGGPQPVEEGEAYEGGAYESRLCSTCISSESSEEQKIVRKVVHEIANEKEIAHSDESKSRLLIECCVCMEESKANVIFPCGHSEYCGQCVLKLSKCAICRKSISLHTELF